MLVDPGLDLGKPGVENGIRTRMRTEEHDGPLVLLADIVPLTEVYKVGDGLGSEQLEAVDDVDLTKDTIVSNAYFIDAATIEIRRKMFSWAYWGVTPAVDELGYRALGSLSSGSRGARHYVTEIITWKTKYDQYMKATETSKARVRRE